VLTVTWAVRRAGKVAEADGHRFIFGMEFVLDSGEGAEDQIAGVGHDGGAAGMDAILGLEMEEAGEEGVDGDGGGKFGETDGEGGGEINGCVLALGELGVVSAEERLRIWDKEAAASAVDEMMLTPG
jgi:hypothetical protein